MAHSLILHIPHASSFIPQSDLEDAFLPHLGASSYVDSIRQSGEIQRQSQERRASVQKELLSMTDWYTDELFDHRLGNAVIAPVSRLVCDMERFSHDTEEPMAEKGMGFCYTNGSRNQIIKEVSPSYRDEVLWRWYAPHHIALTDAVTSDLLSDDRALILDCHSFFPTPLPYEPDQEGDRPDICLGTDPYHTPEELTELSLAFFRSRGFRVKLNSPYAGTMAPLRYYRAESRVESLMVELNRNLYLEPGTNEKNAFFHDLQRILFDFELLLREFDLLA